MRVLWIAHRPGHQVGWTMRNHLIKLEDGTVWPDPNDPYEVQRTLRYGKPTRQEILFAAEVMDAYSELMLYPYHTKKPTMMRRTLRKSRRR